MRLSYLALPLIFALTTPALSGDSEKSDKEDRYKLTEKQQKRYDKRLKDRVVGEPETCINFQDRRRLTAISDNVVIFGLRENARTLYVSKLAGNCSGISRHNALVYDIRGSARLCRGEIAFSLDTTIGQRLGSCSFGEFTPYRRKEADDNG